MGKETVALRLDDVFASTKQFEIYGRDTISFFGRVLPLSFVSNFLFMKYVPRFRRRLSYKELNAVVWEKIFKLLRENNAKLTLGITAAWVEADGRKSIFYKKFPQEAGVIKEAVDCGLVEIANHGLTHCVVGKHMPRPFSSNRLFHREFWPWVEEKVHKEHVETAQKLLMDYFGCEVVTIIPPGNVWTEYTEKIAVSRGIKYLASHEGVCETGKRSGGLIYIGDKRVIAFHDREIALNGVQWFKNLLRENKDKEIITVKELGDRINSQEEVHNE